ncbi:MAG: type II secretion system protein [Tepidisphaeraceae bacterium]
MSVGSHRCPTKSGRHTFTLIELLVVVGIIAVLIAILLPMLAQSRKRAQQVKCLSNMRQIVGAMMAFANENKGLMPARGGDKQYYVNPSTKTISVYPGDPPPTQEMADWLVWTRLTDPLTLKDSTAPMMNITQSALTKYLGGKFRVITDKNKAAFADRALDALFRCPGDTLERPSTSDDSHGFDRYSYAANLWFMNPIATPATRYEGSFTGKIGSIRNPGERILLVCQDEKTIYNSEYDPRPDQWSDSSKILDVVSDCHDGKARRTSFGRVPSGASVKLNMEDARGNVVFADGHGAFMGRKDALRQRYTGRPTADPAGF